MSISTSYHGRTLNGQIPRTVTTTSPLVTSDSSHGYIIGSTWINTTTGVQYTLVDDTPGAAVWKASVVGTPPTALTDNSGGSATNTISVVTAPAALTNSIGGTPATTLAAVTNIANAGSADVGPVANGMNQLAVNAIADRAAIVSLTNAVASLTAKVNTLITAV